MKILVVGAGGREHAIAAKFLESPHVTRVYCAPGNAGMSRDGIVCLPISELDNAALVAFARTQRVSFTFVGPETALMNGIADAFTAAGQRIFAPSQAAAAIEGSKAFAKALMTRAGLPTADYATFVKFDEALDYVKKQGAPIVVKSDGLAAGKGVTVAQSLSEAEAALTAIFDGGLATEARVVIEECLTGVEFSLFCFVAPDGAIYPMPVAQDHKRAYDGDKGPNTGGMGAYSPVPQISDATIALAIESVVKPTVAALVADGKPFIGVLYAGLMLTADGLRTIEFNARFGDPETQVVLSRLTSDFALAIDAMLDGRKPELHWLSDDSVTLGIVVVADGYPGDFDKGHEIPNIPSNLTRYYAGVTEDAQGRLLSDGGRVYLLAQTGPDVATVQKSLYNSLDRLDNSGLFYRHDIGSQALK